MRRELGWRVLRGGGRNACGCGPHEHTGLHQAAAVEIHSADAPCWRVICGAARSRQWQRQHALKLSTILEYIVSNHCAEFELAACAAGADHRAIFRSLDVNMRNRSARRCASTAAIPIGRSPRSRRSAGRRARALRVYVALNLEAYAFGEGMLDELVPLSPRRTCSIIPGSTTATASAPGAFWSFAASLAIAADGARELAHL